MASRKKSRFIRFGNPDNDAESIPFWCAASKSLPLAIPQERVFVIPERSRGRENGADFAIVVQRVLREIRASNHERRAVGKNRFGMELGAYRRGSQNVVGKGRQILRGSVFRETDPDVQSFGGGVVQGTYEFLVGYGRRENEHGFFRGRDERQRLFSSVGRSEVEAVWNLSYERRSPKIREKYRPQEFGGSEIVSKNEIFSVLFERALGEIPGREEIFRSVGDGVFGMDEIERVAAGKHVHRSVQQLVAGFAIGAGKPVGVFFQDDLHVDSAFFCRDDFRGDVRLGQEIDVDQEFFFGFAKKCDEALFDFRIRSGDDRFASFGGKIRNKKAEPGRIRSDRAARSARRRKDARECRSVRGMRVLESVRR